MTVRRRHWELLSLALLVCSIYFVTAIGASAAKHSHSSRAHLHPSAHAAGPLLAASHRRAQMDRLLVAEAKRYTRCLGARQPQPKRCAAPRKTLQRAGGRLARAERRLARVAGSMGRAAKVTSGTPRSHGRRAAPQLSVSGESLGWASVAGAKTYVLRRRVPGQRDSYTVIHGTSATPPPVPGATVGYAVRTTARWSFWSSPATVSYPRSPSTVSPDARSAPSPAVAGQTLSWNAIPGVSVYIVMRTVPGRAPQYSALAGTSLTVPLLPGATAHYSVRTAVAGSVWSPPAAASLPGATASSRAAAIRAAAVRAAREAEALPISPPASPPSLPPGLIVGVDTGGWRGNLFNELSAGGIRNLRVSDLSSTAATEAEAAGCSIAVLTFQSGGTIGGRNPAAYAGEVLAYARRRPEVRRIEVLNEPELLSDSHNYSGYVALLKATHEALASLPAAERPELLASWAPTYGFGKGWAAAGGLPYVDEVVVHAYGGGTGQHKGLEGARELVAEAHTESGKPVAVTEVGWPTAVGQPATGDSQQWSEAQQAAAIASFAAWAHTQPYISVVIFFNAVDYGSNMWYGIERANRSHKPSFAALAAAAR